MGKSAQSASKVDIVDTKSTFVVIDAVKARHGESVSFAYAPLLKRNAAIRKELGLAPAEVTFAHVAIDLMSESQGRFVDALVKIGCLVQPIDYRHVWVSDLAVSVGERTDRRLASLSPQIAYVIGLLAGRADPEVLVVTGSFDLYHPLKDFVENRGGKAAIVFFRRFLDDRWAQNGLLDPDSLIKFVDLEPVSEDLLGIDVSTLTSTGTPERRGGLAKL